MAVELVQGNKANRFFNKVADGAAEFIKSSLHNYDTPPIRSFGDTLHHEELGFALMVWIPAAKTVQVLASLSASVTGGRRTPAAEPRRATPARW